MLVVHRIIYMVLYIPGGAGFLPATGSVPPKNGFFAREFPFSKVAFSGSSRCVLLRFGVPIIAEHRGWLDNWFHFPCRNWLGIKLPDLFRSFKLLFGHPYGLEFHLTAIPELVSFCPVHFFSSTKKCRLCTYDWGNTFYLMIKKNRI